MPEVSNRIILYPKDVMQLTGMAGRTCRRLVADIKKKYDVQFVTVPLFCAHTKINEKIVMTYLANH